MGLMGQHQEKHMNFGNPGEEEREQNRKTIFKNRDITYNMINIVNTAAC